jgi:hypothetical protein
LLIGATGGLAFVGAIGLVGAAINSFQSTERPHYPDARPKSQLTSRRREGELIAARELAKPGIEDLREQWSKYTADDSPGTYDHTLDEIRGTLMSLFTAGTPEQRKANRAAFVGVMSDVGYELSSNGYFETIAIGFIDDPWIRIAATMRYIDQVREERDELIHDAVGGSIERLEQRGTVADVSKLAADNGWPWARIRSLYEQELQATEDLYRYLGTSELFPRDTVNADLLVKSSQRAALVPLHEAVQMEKLATENLFRLASGERPLSRRDMAEKLDRRWLPSFEADMVTENDPRWGVAVQQAKTFASTARDMRGGVDPSSDASAKSPVVAMFDKDAPEGTSDAVRLFARVIKVCQAFPAEITKSFGAAFGPHTVPLAARDGIDTSPGG